MNATTAYALSKQYVDETLVGAGALKGSPCEIDKVVHQNGINTITFKWQTTDGNVRYQDVIVNDGTPIYVWNSGDVYHYGDLVIYAAQFYRCIVENNDFEFDPTHWNEIGSSDGNYDIVEAEQDLPVRFTAADRKMYYVIEEGCFYLWDGQKWSIQQDKSITNEDIDLLFKDL